MTEQLDLSILDRPEILEVLFPVVYSPYYPSNSMLPSPTAAPYYTIEVEKGIKINCGFWISGRENPIILYFHGNGETVPSYSYIASLYSQRGLNLFVAEYRGYGSSNGKPTVSNMLGDARIIYECLKDVINKDGLNKRLFLMGRSLGSIPATELALYHQGEISGLIIESGTASNFRDMWSHLGLSGSEPVLNEPSLFLNKVKMRQIHIPTLIIHGENDELISVEEGKELYENSAAQDKQILIVPGAGHNDIMMLDQDTYFSTVEEFIKNCVRGK